MNMDLAAAEDNTGGGREDLLPELLPREPGPGDPGVQAPALIQQLRDDQLQEQPRFVPREAVPLGVGVRHRVPPGRWT